MIKYTKDTDNIVTLTLDMQSRSANVINHEIGEAFLPVVEHLKREKHQGALRGVILTSAKKSFLEGGDLDYLRRMENASDIFIFNEKLKRFLRDLESPGVPVVAAINGAALGTGFEVALACHHRIVVNLPKVRLGLPEINLGMMPGSGGVIRLMWLLGIEKAFPILTGGRHYSPSEALHVGIIDELAKDRADMMEKAKAWLMENKEGRRPWDRLECQIPGGTIREIAVANYIRHKAVELTGKWRHNYPAPTAILNVLAEGSKVDFDTACQIEGRYYTALLQSRACKNMTKALWFDYQAIEQGKNRPKGYGKFRPKKVGVIGAGMMGSGIAWACLQNGLSVVLKDVSRAIAERGLIYVQSKSSKLIEEGRLLVSEREDLMKNLQITEDPQDFEDCDLVIEAVFENPMVKQKVTREAEAFIDEYSLFASNTISIPITQLAKASVRPQNYIGLHFFAPADETPLVEIVRGDQTSNESVARAFDFVRKIDKIPIVVKDDWGFYAARVRNTYILEGVTMLEEGYPPALIENLGKQSGMPQGALASADDFGLHMVLRYEQQAAMHYGNKYIQHPAVGVLKLMIEELQRSGRGKKAGFYSYTQEDNRQLWSELPVHFPVVQQTFDRSEITERLLFAQVIEAVWCMQEKVIRSIPAANLGSIYGWGFPAFKGGVIQYIADYGKDAFIKRCGFFEKEYGPRFKAPPLLKKMKI